VRERGRERKRRERRGRIRERKSDYQVHGELNCSSTALEHNFYNQRRAERGERKGGCERILSLYFFSDVTDDISSIVDHCCVSIYESIILTLSIHVPLLSFTSIRKQRYPHSPEKISTRSLLEGSCNRIIPLIVTKSSETVSGTVFLFVYVILLLEDFFILIFLFYDFSTCKSEQKQRPSTVTGLNLSKNPRNFGRLG
jgi:hypothetical protein